MNRSCDDYEEYEDEWGERPALEWVKRIEADGDQFEMADRGMGFLTSALKAPEGEINGDGDENAESPSTVGAPGMGKVINGLDREEELALYRELHGAYWVRNTLRQFVAVAVIGISLYLSSQSVDLEAAAYALLTLVVTVTYLKGN